MIEQYKVIKPFSGLKTGDVLEYNKEHDMYSFFDSIWSENYSDARSVNISSSLIEEYLKSGLLEAVKSEDNDSEKIGKLQDLIAALKNKYTQRNKTMKRRYNDGKVQPCVKTEHDTVHYNLMKLLNKFEEIINE